MTFLEKDLEQIIFETPNIMLKDKGLRISGLKKRQVRIGNYGIADLITLERVRYSDGPDRYTIQAVKITIYELKQNKISVGALLQAARYAKGVENYIGKRFPKMEFNIAIQLIGKEIDLKSDFVYLSDFTEKIKVITYSYGFNGIAFTNHSNYALTNEGFA